MDAQLIIADALEALTTMPSNVADMCVTSPPYYGLRDYGVDGQIGLEESPEKYIYRLVAVFHEFKRVLRDDGTLWVNIGDSYATGTKAERQQSNNPGVGGNRPEAQNSVARIGTPTGCKTKDLIGIPWMLAFALRADGWYLRQEIIWAKPNPMPESVKDRCTKSHESIFLFSKQPHYYFNAEAIAEPVAESTVIRMAQDVEGQAGSERVPGKTNGTMKAVPPRYGGNKHTENHETFNRTKSGNAYDYRPYRNKRDVWTVSTTPCKEAHFATYPKELIEPCILAGSRKGGLVVDMFCGSGTTGIVALSHERRFTGIEINPTYAAIAEKRIERETDWQTQMVEV